tara:strand:- start:42 stop:662 length:621 start_codon:yes stop_codon:yes gene_type:complete
MKPGPVLAMIALILVGMWLVLQPTLSREAYDYALRIGAVEIHAEQAEDGYRFVEPERLADLGVLPPAQFLAAIDAEREAWEARPQIEQTLLGFFNITSWTNFVWVAVGLGGQIAFFGRMMIQWVTSENKRQSVVPEMFWWFSLIGGVCLFTYFVWRVDFVGVLGQSTGVVIYARNLRLIHKQRRREARAATNPDPNEDPAHARAAG